MKNRLFVIFLFVFMATLAVADPRKPVCPTRLDIARDYLLLFGIRAKIYDSVEVGEKRFAPLEVRFIPGENELQAEITTSQWSILKGVRQRIPVEILPASKEMIITSEGEFLIKILLPHFELRFMIFVDHPTLSAPVVVNSECWLKDRNQNFVGFCEGINLRWEGFQGLPQLWVKNPFKGCRGFEVSSLPQ